MNASNPTKTSISTRICAGLSHLISDSSVFAQRMRAFHWNVEGSDFTVLHKTFGDLYDLAGSHIDEMAERVRALDQFPTSRLVDFLQDSCLKEGSPKIKARDMVERAIQDLQHIGEEQLKLHSLIGDEDPVTKMMLEAHLGGYEKHIWFLRSYLK